MQGLVRRLRWLRDDRGQDLIEYAVLAAFVSLTAVIASLALNSAVASLYGSTTGHITRGANFATVSSATTTDSNCAKSKDASSDSSCK